MNFKIMGALQANNDWQKKNSDVFWAEIAPCDHVVQIYETDDSFLELLLGFVASGINAGECVIVIATPSHLRALNYKLQLAGFDVTSENELYIPLDAEATLSKFMVNDWPDETLFLHLVSDIITNARLGGRPVRAFGEMVAVLWARGHVGATVRLEQLWNKFCETQAFCLFCAYPQNGFTQDATESVMHICGTHSKMITTSEEGTGNISYRTITQKTVG
jgi:hypothetical protein